MKTSILPETHIDPIQAAIGLFHKGHPEDAATICFNVLQKKPQHADAFHLLGLIARGRCDWQAAQTWMAKALSAAPLRPDILNDYGLILMDQMSFAEAVIQFERAIHQQPRMTRAYFNKGLAYKAMGATSAALSAFRTALTCEPDFSKAYFCIGDLLATQGNLEEAAHHFLAAIRINSEYIAAYNHLAVCLADQGRLHEAVQWLSKAHEISPRCADTLCNMGNLMRKLRRFDEAALMYRSAIAIRPEFIEAHFNLSLILLLMEDFTSGWQEYEWRLKHFRAASGYPYRHGLPLWDGRSPAGKSILIYDEQGFGDIFMFCRFLKELKAMQATVVFETRIELYELFKCFPWADEVVLRQADLKPRITCDYCLPLFSLPHRLNITKKNIPSQVPYLSADHKKITQWSRRITGPGMKIGLVWQGSNADPARKLNFNQLYPLSRITGICWYSLQKNTHEGPSPDAQSEWLNPLGPHLADFTDTAAAIANMDLVLTIDTAVAHLAGAMGKPVWVLLPYIADWRWFLDRSDSPWYPTMRLFRQTAPGDWQTPLMKIVKTLKYMLETCTKKSAASEQIGILLHEANSYRRNGEHEKALQTYRRILAVAPDCHEAFFSIGVLYLETARYPEAIITFEQALKIKPGDHPTLNNLGLAYHRSGQTSSAKQAFHEAIEHRPDYATAYYNLGNLYLDSNDLDSTIYWYRRALELNPDDARAQCEMGKLYLKHLDLANARNHFQKAVAIDSQYAEAQISLATTVLLQGDFTNGWAYYQQRFRFGNTREQAYPYQYRLPLWRGESFSDRKLIVHAEQGFGDTIQFSRFLPDVKARGGHVTFQVQPPLMPLFENFPGVDTLEPLPQVRPVESDADLYVPLMDLPACVDITLSTIPAPCPYLSADRQKVKAWRQRFNTEKFKVGLVWSGNPQHKNDHHRSCNLTDLIGLNSIEGVQFYSLQKQVNSNEMSILKTDTGFIHIGGELRDFGDTAAAIDCLDLVITVDTAIAHLAGAMAKPVWVLIPFLPDWRWMLQRTDSPWYPGMRLFRQPRAADWQSVIDLVMLQLRLRQCQ